MPEGAKESLANKYVPYPPNQLDLLKRAASSGNPQFGYGNTGGSNLFNGAPSELGLTVFSGDVATYMSATSLIGIND